MNASSPIPQSRVRYRSGILFVLTTLTTVLQTGCFGLFAGTPSSRQTTAQRSAPTAAGEHTAGADTFPTEDASDLEAEKQKAAFALAEKENTIEAYQQFASQYPDSRFRLEVAKRIGDQEWNGIVKTGAESELKAYLDAHPSGYYSKKAELMMRMLAYHKENKEEVDQKYSVLKAAQKAVDKSPLTVGWEVLVIDFVDGNVYYNLNSGPEYDKTKHKTIQDLDVYQRRAYSEACSLMQRKVPEVERCLHSWTIDNFDPRKSISPAIPIAASIEQFYLRGIERGIEFDLTRLLELLDMLSELNEKHILTANVYSLLGMDNLAIYALYQYVVSQEGRSSLGKNIEYQFLRGKYQSLENNPDYKWVIELGGGGYTTEKREMLKQQIAKDGQ
jgi:hypothetical protein